MIAANKKKLTADPQSKQSPSGSPGQIPEELGNTGRRKCSPLLFREDSVYKPDTLLSFKWKKLGGALVTVYWSLKSSA